MSISYIFAFLFLMISCKGNFTAYFDICLYIVDLIMLYYGFSRRIFKASDLRMFSKFAVLFLIFITLRFFILNSLPYHFFFSDIFFLVRWAFFSFVFCAIIRENTVYYLAKVTLDLAYLSIFFFFMQLINPATIKFVGQLISLPPRTSNPGYTNFLLYTFDTVNHPFRNSGFSWEPGAYGCFLDIGLLYYLLVTGFKFNKDVMIYVIAIATTQSTTTYIGLLIIVILYARVNGLKTSTMLLVLVPSLALCAVALPFMFDKIGRVWEEDQAIIYKIEELGDWYLRNGGQVALNRFGSIIYLWQQFHWSLLWGISNGYQDATKLANLVNLSNGDFDFMAKFGFVGLVFFMYRYLQLIKKFLYKNEYLFYCGLLMLTLGFGEPFLTATNQLCLLFLYKYTDPAKFFREQQIYEQETLVEQTAVEVIAETAN